MTCSASENLFAAHVEGLLNENLERELQAHLATCVPCRLALDETRRLILRLEKEVCVGGTATITDEVMDRIVREQAIRLRHHGTLRHVIRVSAAAAVLIAVIVVLFHGVSRPDGGRIFAAELSAARQRVEDAKTVTWQISYYQWFSGLGGGRWFRINGFDQRYLYKAPGLYRCEHVDKDGNVVYVSIEDQASRARLDIDHKTKTATLNHVTESTYPLHGPFVSYRRLMQRDDLQSLGTQDIAGRSTNGFRYEPRSDLLSDDHSIDFWLDAVNKQLALCQQPGGDLFKTTDIVRDEAWTFSTDETIEYQGRVFKIARGRGVFQGHIIRNIGFDVDLEDALFALVPPAGYVFKTVKPPPITEEDVIEFMGVVAEYYGKTFPDRMPHFAQSSKEDLERLERAQRAVHRQTGASAAEVKLVDAMDRWWRTGIPGPGPMHIFITQQIVDGSWKYVGKGVKLGEKDRMVCWYRSKGSRTYHVVYGDLSIKEAEPEELPLPVSP